MTYFGLFFKFLDHDALIIPQNMINQDKFCRLL